MNDNPKKTTTSDDAGETDWLDTAPGRARWVLERDCLIIGLLADASFCAEVLTLVRKAGLQMGGAAA